MIVDYIIGVNQTDVDVNVSEYEGRAGDAGRRHRRRVDAPRLPGRFGTAVQGVIKGIRCFRDIRGMTRATGVAGESFAQVKGLSRGDGERFAGPSPVGVPEAESVQATRRRRQCASILKLQVSSPDV